jgi:hypothetical protein
MVYSAAMFLSNARFHDRALSNQALALSPTNAGIPVGEQLESVKFRTCPLHGQVPWIAGVWQLIAS